MLGIIHSNKGDAKPSPLKQARLRYPFSISRTKICRHGSWSAVSAAERCHVENRFDAHQQVCLARTHGVQPEPVRSAGVRQHGAPKILVAADLHNFSSLAFGRAAQLRQRGISARFHEALAPQPPASHEALALTVLGVACADPCCRVSEL